MRGYACLVSGALALAAGACAQAATPSIEAAESSVRLGLTAGYGNYEENIQPQDTEAGALLGLEAGVSSLTPTAFGRFGWPDLYVSVSYDFSAGFFQYRGNLQDAEHTPYQAQDNSYYNTAIVRLGLDAQLRRMRN